MDGWETIRERLADVGLAELAQPLVALARPCIRYRVEGPNESTRSRAGGTPLVPADFLWPVSNGRPLAFVAQLDLAVVNDARPGIISGLPARGLLSFFYHAEELPSVGFGPQDGWDVRWYENADGFVPASFPAGVKQRDRFKAASLEPYAAFSMPGWETDEVRSFDLDHEQRSAYTTCVDAGAQNVQTGGYPQLIQGPYGVDGIREGRLMNWGDVGKLYYWIDRDALAARRFDTVQVEMQCC